MHNHPLLTLPHAYSTRPHIHCIHQHEQTYTYWKTAATSVLLGTAWWYKRPCTQTCIACFIIGIFIIDLISIIDWRTFVIYWPNANAVWFGSVTHGRHLREMEDAFTNWPESGCHLVWIVDHRTACWLQRGALAQFAPIMTSAHGS